MKIDFVAPRKSMQPAPRVVIHFDERVAFDSELAPHKADAFHLRHYDSLMKNVAEAEHALRSGNKIILNFHDTEEITIDALAYLLGNIESFQHRYGDKINGTYSRFERVNNLFRESGFLSLLQFKAEATSGEPSLNSAVNLQFQTGTYVLADKISPLREEVTRNNIAIPRQYERKIFRALSEAMLNVHHHAYSSVKFQMRKQSMLKGKWWLGAQYDSSKRILSFVMYDIGRGIPVTMPRNYEKTYLEKFADNGLPLTDADLIYAATRKGKTSTGKRHRGLGLPDMHSIVENNSGELKIYSRFGRYYSSGKNSFRQKLDEQCTGTLVVWRLFTENLDGIQPL